MAITLTNVRFSYDSQPNNTIINIPKWSVDTGEHVFLHGPSGTGKSTLLGLLSGLITLQTGEISIFDKQLSTMSSLSRDKFRAQYIGYVFQQFNLIPYLSAADNIRLARYFSQHQQDDQQQYTSQLLQQLNFAESDINKPVRQLSVGQQQRVAIARALVNKPKLVIADEPTSSLDAANTEVFMDILMPMVKNNGMTLVFVSHDLSLSRYFDRVESLTDINQQAVV